MYANLRHSKNLWGLSINVECLLTIANVLEIYMYFTATFCTKPILIEVTIALYPISIPYICMFTELSTFCAVLGIHRDSLGLLKNDSANICDANLRNLIHGPAISIALRLFSSS